MRTLVVVSVICCAIAQALALDGDRIVGGVNANKLEFPWQVSLQYNGRHICGGSVVSSNWVVTASHCIVSTSTSAFRVRVGEHDLSIKEGTEDDVPVSRLIKHPNYNSRTLDYDLALIQLARPLEFNGQHKHIKPIALPSANQNFEGVSCISSGWGLLQHQGSMPNILQKVSLPVWQHSQCQRAYQFVNTVTARMTCAGYPEGGKSPCNGDSGGPLSCNVGGKYYLAGAVSWGTRCAAANQPGVYAKVTSFLSWVNQYVR